MTQEELLNKIANFHTAIANNDVGEIINSFTTLGIDASRHLSNQIVGYTCDLMIKAITEYVAKNGKLKINRNNEYGSPTFDVYIIKDGKLCRNGSHVIYTGIGKLYTAYKQVYNK